MSYHLSFLSPRFRLSVVISDRRINEIDRFYQRFGNLEYGYKCDGKDDVVKVERITDHLCISCSGLMPLGWLYRDYLRELWMKQINYHPKADLSFLKGKEFQHASRTVLENNLWRLKRGYSAAGIQNVSANTHIIVAGISIDNHPFFLTINQGPNDNFSHALMTTDNGEFPNVYPMNDKEIMDWAKNAVAATKLAQDKSPTKEEFTRRVEMIFGEAFSEINRLASDISPSCDIALISREGTTWRRQSNVGKGAK
jgi:hypothetical protein